jgi:pyruvate formate lyase activating enzyme
MKIYGFQGISVIDFPGKIASILFLGGCNFRCPFCQNASLVEGYEQLDVISIESVFKHLEQRKDFIDGVVITGGEPLLNRKGLTTFLGKLQEMKLAIKIDTNGYNTSLLRELLMLRMVDYVAMDIKTSIDKYHIAAGMNIDTARILASIETIRKSSIEYEFRTTCVPGLVDSREIESIAQLIEGAAHYYLQQYRVEEPMLDPSYIKLSPYSSVKLESFRAIARKFVSTVDIRGL